VVVAELDPTGANLLFSTYIGSGGLGTSSPAGLAVDSAGDIYLAGNNLGPGLITTLPAHSRRPPATTPPAAPTACRQDLSNRRAHLQSGTLANGRHMLPEGCAGSWAQVKGTNLSTTTRIWGTSDFTGYSLPTNLSGVQVMVNNQAAAVYYISPTQISFQVRRESRARRPCR